MTEAGVDLVEVQMPFTEPIADGETFALASQIAVAEGMTNASYFSLLANVRETTTIPVVAMGYYNWPHRMGLDSFANTLSALGVVGWILPDLPLEESADLRSHTDKHDLASIFMMTPTDSDDRLGTISQLTTSPVAKAPVAPINLSAAPGDGEVTLTWTDTRNDEILENYDISSDGGASYRGIGTNVSDSGTTTVSYTVMGLTNGTVYTFKVKAENSAGTGPPSDPGVTETPLFATPRGLQASPGGGQVTLSWDDPVFSVYNTNTITGYELSIDGGTNYSSITGSGATTTEHTVTGLTGGTAQTFAVRAVKGVAATVSETPLFTPPAYLAAIVGDQQIELNWTDPENTFISGYEVSSDNGTNYTPIATTTSHTVLNLSNGTEYSFAVRAVNCPANGAAAMVAAATPLFAAPTGLTATAGDRQVMLSWTDPGNSNISGYEVSSDGGTNYSAISDGDSEPTTISHTVRDLAGGTSYTFAVRAVNGAPATVTATPLIAAPTGLTAEADDGQVELSWTDPGNSNISSYELNIDGGAFAAIGDSDASTTRHTVTGLINGTTYTFGVRAVNGAGAMVDATPLFAAPTGLQATAGDG